MQRLLTALVLVLVVAVSALGVAVYKLGDASDASARQPLPTRPAVVREPSPADEARIAEQDRKIRQLLDEVASLRRELRSRPEPEGASSGSPASGGGGAVEGGPAPVVAAPGVRPRDGDGNLIITEEDVEHFAKVQEHVLRQQRIDNQTRGVMLRVDRMASRGEILPLAPDRRREIERVLRKYVAAGDDLTARYLRSPDDEVRDLTSEQRRDELTRARGALVTEAQRELDPILGPDDAHKIADEALQRPWGLGRTSRRFESER
jgi:hypothetical protein